MPCYLLDANVLIALAWPAHSLHECARRWFSRHSHQGWATCPMTQAALVRVLSNPSFSEHALTVAGALEVLTRNLQLPGHQFWPDSIPANEALERLETPITGHLQITNAYLIALAVKNGGRLATLDRGIARLAPPGVVEVIE